MMMGQFYAKIRSHGFKLLTRSVESFETCKEQKLFEKFKYHGDLHNLGIMLYMDFKLFCMRLCIANEDMILNAHDACNVFNKPLNQWYGRRNSAMSA